MGTRIVIDPITRIEGHLRIDCEVDGGRVSNAWASGTMWRGVEQILLGRDPRDAWAITQRFCGVCTTVHAIASVRAVENALEMAVPKNAQYIRNLMIAAFAKQLDEEGPVFDLDRDGLAVHRQFDCRHARYLPMFYSYSN